MSIFNLVFFKFNRLKKLGHPDNITAYNEWIKKKESINSVNDVLKYRPKISILVPVFNVELHWLKKAVESVEKQTYDNWELCIVDDNSTKLDIPSYLLEKSMENNKIKVKILKKNLHISAATNEALKMATGEFIALLDHDDELLPYALYEVAKVLDSHPDVDLVYSDEDKLTIEGNRIFPAFKSSWNPEMLFSFMYVGHLGVYRKSIIDKIGGFRVGFEGSQDYDLILRFTEETQKVYHINKILYHWRMIPGSTAVEVNSKSYAYDRGRIALEQSLKRRGFGNVRVIEDDLIKGNYRPIFPITEKIRVTIIVIFQTNSDNDILRQTIDDIYKNTDYTNYEIIVLAPQNKNSYSIQNIGDNVIFFDSLNKGISSAVQKSSGDHIVFVKNSVLFPSKDWLVNLLMYSQRRETGCICGMVISKNEKILYSGAYAVFTSNSLNIFFPDQYSEKNEFGYLGRIRRVQNVTVTSESVFMVKKSLLEKHLQLLADKYYWIYLSLQFHKEGIRNVYNPYVCFIDNKVQQSICLPLNSELKKWRNESFQDPYLNPNISYDSEGKLNLN